MKKKSTAAPEDEKKLMIKLILSCAGAARWRHIIELHV